MYNRNRESVNIIEGNHFKIYNPFVEYGVEEFSRTPIILVENHKFQNGFVINDVVKFTLFRVL